MAAARHGRRAWGAAAVAALFAAQLAGCAPPDYPGAPLLEGVADLPAPEIAPMEPIRAARPEMDADAARASAALDELVERGEDLRTRAEALRSRRR